MIVTAYAHCDKESMYSRGEENGLAGDALNSFMYALYEVEFELDVNEQTGEAEIISVNGKRLCKCPEPNVFQG